MQKKGVLVVGSVNMDLVVQTDRFPKPGETIFGNRFEMFPGGKGANQAVGCAKLGIETYFIGKTGTDDFAERLIKSMNSNNVNTSLVAQEEETHTGMALITVDEKGENEIIVISGTNMLVDGTTVSSNEDVFQSVQVVLSQLEIPLETVIKVGETAAKNNVEFILNPAPGCQLPQELLKNISYLTPNETELELISGIKVTDDSSAEKAAKAIIDKGVSNVIVTLGSKGSLLVNKERTKSFNSFTASAVDTTAAGDSFNAALAYALAEKYKIDDAIEFANCAASIAVTRMGAQTSMPSYDEVNAKIKQNKSTPED